MAFVDDARDGWRVDLHLPPALVYWLLALLLVACVMVTVGLLHRRARIRAAATAALAPVEEDEWPRYWSSLNPELLLWIIDKRAEALVVIDEEDRIVAWSSGAENLLGWRAEEVLGQRLAETIIPEEYRRHHLAGIARFLRTRESVLYARIVELPALIRSGTQRHCFIHLSHVEIQGQWYFCAVMGAVEHYLDTRATASPMRWKGQPAPWWRRLLGWR